MRTSDYQVDDSPTDILRKDLIWGIRYSIVSNSYGLAYEFVLSFFGPPGMVRSFLEEGILLM